MLPDLLELHVYAIVQAVYRSSLVLVSCFNQLYEN
jgi:hypothetical protein